MTKIVSGGDVIFPSQLTIPNRFKMTWETIYKIFAKILATRLQTFLGTLIGDIQQGFVAGRRMDKAVVVMMVTIYQVDIDSLYPMTSEVCTGILFLDFAKAYDTVIRQYLYRILSLFGFSSAFVKLIMRLHEGTTAEFNQISEPLSVISGLRQGCPLASLLFILAVEPLALALLQDNGFTGITIGDEGRKGEHIFSAFVDDSTIFLNKASQVSQALQIVERFGALSGLKIQRKKSHFLFLGQTLYHKEWNGIPVVQPGDTTRYLSYEIGLTILNERN